MTIKKNVPANGGRNVVKAILIFCRAMVDAAAVADVVVMAGVAATVDAVATVAFYPDAVAGAVRGAHMALRNPACIADDVCNICHVDNRDAAAPGRHNHRM
jgi:hypothetical protein